MLEGKRIVLGVTGGIAAYKACELVRLLIKAKAEVQVILTANGARFVTPLTLQTLSGNKVHLDAFESPEQWRIGHISLARSADLLIVAPATANVIAKVAAGICDDLLATTICAASCKTLFAPAMNVQMWRNPIVQRNVATLTELGYLFAPPGVGELACKDVGEGRMAEPELILEHATAALTDKLLAGRRVLISAGPTCEPLDPVRHLTNRSSGRMGFALARAAWRMGGRVQLVSGPVNLDDPAGIETVRVRSAEQMLHELGQRFSQADLLVMAAAVADVRPVETGRSKLPKSELPQSLELARTPDIVAELAAQRRPGQVLVGFAAETDELLSRAQAKLERKGLDMIVANDVSRSDIGFDSQNNEAMLIMRAGPPRNMPLMHKDRLAEQVLIAAAELLGR